MRGRAKRVNKFPPLRFREDFFGCCEQTYMKQNNKNIRRTDVVAVWKSWVCKYSIRFQVIKLKFLCETLKNEKWKIFAWYPNKILNAAIDAERTFKCKWPNISAKSYLLGCGVTMTSYTWIWIWIEILKTEFKLELQILH